jgi:hypothetical protein
MTEPPAPDPETWNPAHIEIQQIGRWRYSIWISHGFLRTCGEYGTYRYGYDRAVKKGQRMLVQYLRDEKRRKNVTRIS